MDVERARDLLSGAPAESYFQERIRAGWELVAVEWQRQVPGRVAAHTEETPFGLQVADDGWRLQDNDAERLALMRIMELVVKDMPLTQVAAELNQAGYRTRRQAEWTPGAVFDLLPRLIEAGPRLLTDSEYVARKRASTSTA